MDTNTADSLSAALKGQDSSENYGKPEAEPRAAENVGAYVGHKVDDAASAMGSGLKSLGESVREHGSHTGMVGDATNVLSDTLETTGRFLQEDGLSAITQDITNVVRRNPLPAVFAAIGLGFLIGAATGRRS